MSRVFIPQVPSRYDSGANLWVPTINIKPAQQWGELVTILPPAASRTGIDLCAEVIRRAMEDYNTEDYLVAVGDPTLYAIAAVVAARKAEGTLRMLKWDRIQSRYILEEVTV